MNFRRVWLLSVVMCAFATHPAMAEEAPQVNPMVTPLLVAETSRMRFEATHSGLFIQSQYEGMNFGSIHGDPTLSLVRRGEELPGLVARARFNSVRSGFSINELGQVLITADLGEINPTGTPKRKALLYYDPSLDHPRVLLRDNEPIDIVSEPAFFTTLSINNFNYKPVINDQGVMAFSERVRYWRQGGIGRRGVMVGPIEGPYAVIAGEDEAVPGLGSLGAVFSGDYFSGFVLNESHEIFF